MQKFQLKDPSTLIEKKNNNNPIIINVSVTFTMHQICTVDSMPIAIVFK